MREGLGGYHIEDYFVIMAESVALPTRRFLKSQRPWKSRSLLNTWFSRVSMHLTIRKVLMTLLALLGNSEYP
jgi:hypothetical protein